MLFGDLTAATLVARLFVLMTAFTVHEFAHAWTADHFGDNTPRQYGRLTLNPLDHLDIFGSIMLLVAGFGWAKPVPINPYVLQKRSPAGVMWVSLAGPMSNLLMAIVGAIPFRMGWLSIQQAYYDTYISTSKALLPSLPQLTLEFISINLILMLFNLIPLAPLDGDKIADYVLPPKWSDTLARIRPYGPMLLMVLLFGLPCVGIDIIGWIIRPAMNAMFQLLIG